MSLAPDTALEKTFANPALKPSEIRILELDGIRGLAILFVLLWHCIGAPLQPAFVVKELDGGFFAIAKQSTIILRSGVDLFFVLSGFLIGGILIDHRKSGGFFPVFYGRRALRIFPLYYLLIVLFGLAKASGADGILFEGSLPIGAYLTFTQNYFMTHLNTSGAIWLSVTWSLALEEQFYACFPLFVRYCAGWMFPVVLVSGIVLAPVLRIWTYRHFGYGHAAYVWLPCRIDALFLGALLAYGFRIQAVRTWLYAKRRYLAGVFVALLGGFFALGVAVTKDMDYHSTNWGYTFLTYFYGWGILLSLVYAGTNATRFLRAKWLMFLGAISYGVYLFHLPVLFSVFRLFAHPVEVDGWGTEGLVLLSLAITLTVCTAFYFLLEKPAIRFGRRWTY